jgi:hypothetical protein
MLIATLPTYVSDKDLLLARRILNHPLVGAARYNTGGKSPYTPERILSDMNALARAANKTLFVDLEGRQTRVAAWTPHSRGVVRLNRQFEIQLPGQIFFRGAGWFRILNVDKANQELYFEPLLSGARYYLGEGQSVHILAQQFQTPAYLGGLDREFITAAAKQGIDHFMLSFVESVDDIREFNQAYSACPGISTSAQTVLKIESLKGIAFAKEHKELFFSGSSHRLIAARDDLYLGLKHHRGSVLAAMKLIAEIDSQAIVASRIMSGLETEGEVTLADIADAALMASFGYQNFMLSDGMSRQFDSAIESWEQVISPNLHMMEELCKKKERTPSCSPASDSGTK